MSELIINENQSTFEIQTVDLSKGVLPGLDDAQELPFDMAGDYWTPEESGESKNVYFVEIKTQKVLSANGTGELIDLDCAVFIELKEGIAHTILNGSRRLVGTLEQLIATNRVKQGMPLKITYMGKKKNKSNSFSSDNWSIKPLVIIYHELRL